MKKHQTTKLLLTLALMLMLALGLSVHPSSASEVTGTLSTAPEANNNTESSNVSNTTQNNTTPTGANTIRGAVTGGVPVAQADEYGSTQSASALGGENSNWIWITIPVLLLVGAVVYVFTRPSHR